MHASNALIGTRRAFPTRIGSQCPSLAVDISLDLRPNMRHGGGHSACSGICPRGPSAPHPQPDRIATGLQEASDIVGIVKNLLRVVGDCWSEHIGADFLSVDIQLCVTGDIDGDKCVLGHGGEVERFPHPRREIQVFTRKTDPLSNPTRRCRRIGRLEDPHTPKRRLAPCSDCLFFRFPVCAFQFFFPHAHLPVAKHTRGERLSLIIDMSALIRDHLAAVPQVARVLLQQIRRTRDEDLVSGLFDSSFRFQVSRFPFPTQPRLRGIDCERIHTKFAAKFSHLGSVVGSGIGGQQKASGEA